MKYNYSECFVSSPPHFQNFLFILLSVVLSPALFTENSAWLFFSLLSETLHSETAVFPFSLCSSTFLSLAELNKYTGVKRVIRIKVDSYEGPNS